MNHIDLFSGVGGFALAASWCWGEDYHNIGHSEIEEFPCKVYHKHFPESECLGDITKIKWQEVVANANRTRSCSPQCGHNKVGSAKDEGRNGHSQSESGGHGRIDLITGGFPCQPYSQAGKRRGKADDRALWHENFRAVREIGPQWFVGENVTGIITMELDKVLSDLEGIGYRTEAFTIPACAVGAPHERDRVWIIAHRDGAGFSRSFSGTEEQDASLRDHASNPEVAGLEGRVPEGTGSAGGCDSKYSVGGEWGYKAEPWKEDWYEVATRFCRVDDGLPAPMDRVARLKALGNAIVPQIAYGIMLAIKEFDERTVQMD